MVEHSDAYPIHDTSDFKAWKLQNQNAAKLLEVIIFSWRRTSAHIRGKPGKWAAFPAEQWCLWSKLSHDKYKRALKTLVQDNLVERERHRFGGLKVHAYIQPTGLALTYQGKETDFARLGKPYAPPPAPTVAPILAPTSALTDHTTSTTLTTLQHSLKICDPLPCIAHPTQGSGKTPGGEQEKENVVSFPQPKTDAHGLPLPLTTKLHLIWEAAHAESYPNSFTALTAINRKQLNDFVSKCPSDYGGNILDHAVRNWSQFIQQAKSSEAAFVWPQQPTTVFLLKFISSAVKLWLDDNSLVVASGHIQLVPPQKSYVVSMPKKLTSPVQLIAAQEKKKKMTKEEFWASMNEPVVLEEDEDWEPQTAVNGKPSSSV